MNPAPRQTQLQRSLRGPKRAVFDGVPVEPHIDRSEIFVGKNRAEKLMPGEAEKIRSHSTLGGYSRLSSFRSPKPELVRFPVADIRKRVMTTSLGSLVGNTTSPVPRVE